MFEIKLTKMLIFKISKFSKNYLVLLSLIAISFLNQNTLCQNTTQTNNLVLCNSGKPFDSSECFSRATTNDYNNCCYLEDFKNQINKICLEIPQISIDGYPFYNYNNVLYRIQCSNLNKKNSLASCGVTTKASGKSDCSEYSSMTESCCYSNDDSMCYLLGAKYSGQTLWAGKNLDCNGTVLSLNIIKTLILILVVMII